MTAKKIAEAVIAGTILVMATASFINSLNRGAEIQNTKIEETEYRVEHLETEVQELKVEIEEIEETTEDSRYALPLGHYTLTAYEWTGNTCANGNYPTAGYTIACNSLPIGTRVYIEGYGEFTVEDRGGMADNVIDIYLGDYDACINFGVQEADVYLVKEDE